MPGQMEGQGGGRVHAGHGEGRRFPGPEPAIGFGGVVAGDGEEGGELFQVALDGAAGGGRESFLAQPRLDGGAIDLLRVAREHAQCQPVAVEGVHGGLCKSLKIVKC